MGRAIPFGGFALVDHRGAVVGAVVIAPGHVLMRRESQSTIRDVSYLAIWTPQRISVVEQELAACAALGLTAVTAAAAPRLHAMLQAIAPASTAVYVTGGLCRKRLRKLQRVQLEAALRAIDHTSLARRAS